MALSIGQTTITVTSDGPGFDEPVRASVDHVVDAITPTRLEQLAR